MLLLLDYAAYGKQPIPCAATHAAYILLAKAQLGNIYRAAAAAATTKKHARYGAQRWAALIHTQPSVMPNVAAYKKAVRASYGSLLKQL